MRNIILISTLLLIPIFGLVAGDIIVNNQSTYAVPPGATGVLILDLTLPENLTSIKILNLGDAQQWDISSMYIFEDGASAGFDGDENEITRKISSPFWDTEISVNPSKLRIFVTVDIASTAASEKTIKPKATINSDKTIVGLERTILAGASAPLVPASPLFQNGEALSSSAIRWHFLDLANNEFGFRLKSNSLKTLVENQNPNLLYLDETGLEPNTCYTGRRVSAFNDRGESLSSMNFAEVCTLVAPVIEEVRPPDLTSEVIATSTSEVDVQEVGPQITIRQKIIEVLTQIIQLLQEKIKLLQASMSHILQFLFK